MHVVSAPGASDLSCARDASSLGARHRNGVDGDVAGVGQLEAVGDGLAGVAERCRIGCCRNSQGRLRGECDAAVDCDRGKSARCGCTGSSGSIGNRVADIAGYRRVAARARGVGAGRERLELCR